MTTTALTPLTDLFLKDIIAQATIAASMQAHIDNEQKLVLDAKALRDQTRKVARAACDAWMKQHGQLSPDDEHAWGVAFAKTYFRVYQHEYSEAKYPQKRVVFRCTSRRTASGKKCGHVWSHTYRVERQASGQYVLYRMVDGKRVTPADDRVCPACSSRAIDADTVKGKKSEAHKCNAACLYAQGPDCSCQCGGLNHARGHQAA